MYVIAIYHKSFDGGAEGVDYASHPAASRAEVDEMLQRLITPDVERAAVYLVDSRAELAATVNLASKSAIWA